MFCFFIYKSQSKQVALIVLVTLVSGSATTSSSVLKQSAFGGGSSILAPSKFQGGANPWKPPATDGTDVGAPSSEATGACLRLCIGYYYVLDASTSISCV